MARGSLKEAGSAEVVDYAATPPPESPIGEPVFDGAIEAYGLSPRLRHALAEGELRQLILSLVDQGDRFERGQLCLSTPKLPKRSGDIIALLEPMLRAVTLLRELQP